MWLDIPDRSAAVDPSTGLSYHEVLVIRRKIEERDVVFGWRSRAGPPPRAVAV